MNEYILIAGVGGVVYNVVPLLEVWKAPKESRPDLGEWLYWLQYIAWPILAAFLMYLYESPELNITKLLAFHIGLSAPLTIRAMLQVSPAIPKAVKLTSKDQ